MWFFKAVTTNQRLQWKLLLTVHNIRLPSRRLYLPSAIIPPSAEQTFFNKWFNYLVTLRVWQAKKGRMKILSKECAVRFCALVFHMLHVMKGRGFPIWSRRETIFINLRATPGWSSDVTLISSPAVVLKVLINVSDRVTVSLRSVKQQILCKTQWKWQK